MAIAFEKSAATASPRAAHAAQRGASRNDQMAQTRARVEKTSRRTLRWPRTVNTARGGAGASGTYGLRHLPTPAGALGRINVSPYAAKYTPLGSNQ